jgi:hypothetical protein
MFIMPKAFPEEFRRDVVAVARKALTTIAKDFGVSPAALHRWLKKADEEDDPKTQAAKEEMRWNCRSGHRQRQGQGPAGTSFWVDVPGQIRDCPAHDFGFLLAKL